MDTTTLVLLIVGGVVLLVSTVLGIIALAFSLLSSAGGWRRLADRYATSRPPSGHVFQRQTLKIGAVRYKRCVTVGIADEGLYLKVWGRVVLIPWGEFQSQVGQTTLYWQRVPVLTVGDPPIATMTMPGDLFELMRGRLAG